MDFIEIIKVLLWGIIEGITEWLPVSSTGHMLLFNAVWPLQQSDAFVEMFKVVIQLGAILAVVVFFWKKLWPWRKEKPQTSEEKMHIVTQKDTLWLWVKVIVACLPAAVLGLLLDDFLEAYLQTPIVIAITLIVYGAAFIVVEKMNEKKTLSVTSTAALTFKQALLIGAFQVLSLIPGTSRSGATILGALIIGVSRPVGAEFTFFLAIPVMVGASGLKLVKFLLESGGFAAAEIAYLAIGMVVAFAISLLVIKFLMDFVKKHSFKIFGWYRIALGALVLATMVIPTFFA